MIVAGLDLGKVKDPSALAIVEERDELLHVVLLDVWTPERDDLGAVPARIFDPVTRHGAAVAFDASGIGRRFAPLLLRSPVAEEVQVYPVVCTHGWRPSTQRADGTVFTPKKELVSTFFASLPRLRVSPTLPFAREFRSEIGSYHRWTGPDGLDRWGAEKGRHDDLVAAVSLAVWLIRALRDRPIGGLQPANRRRRE